MWKSFFHADRSWFYFAYDTVVTLRGMSGINMMGRQVFFPFRSRLSFSAQDPTGKLVEKWSIELSFLISLPKHRVQMLLNCSLKVQSEGVLQNCWVCEDHNSGKGLSGCWNIWSSSLCMLHAWPLNPLTWDFSV